jgi:hypothetical protein
MEEHSLAGLLHKRELGEPLIVYRESASAVTCSTIASLENQPFVITG